MLDANAPLPGTARDVVMHRPPAVAPDPLSPLSPRSPPAQLPLIRPPRPRPHSDPGKRAAQVNSPVRAGRTPGSGKQDLREEADIHIFKLLRLWCRFH